MRAFALPLLACTLTPSFAQRLPPAIDEILKQAPGEAFFSARNLKTGRALEHRGDERVRTASTIKLPIMAALFAEVASGAMRWDQPVVLKKEEIVSGSGILSEFTPGVSLPLRDVMRLMIVVSDNTATNLILERLTADKVNAFLDTLGLKETRSLRKVRGDGTNLKAPSGWSKAGLIVENQKFGIGVSTSGEMVRLLEMLEKGQVVSPAASREMIEVLLRQQYKDGIGRRTGELAVASKSGALDRLRSDAGIVYTPKGAVALAITVDRLPQTDYSADNPALAWIGRLAEALVRELSR